VQGGELDACCLFPRIQPDRVLAALAAVILGLDGMQRAHAEGTCSHSVLAVCLQSCCRPYWFLTLYCECVDNVDNVWTKATAFLTLALHLPSYHFHIAVLGSHIAVLVTKLPQHCPLLTRNTLIVLTDIRWSLHS